MGTLQIRGTVKYAPSRDIVYLLPDIIQTVAQRLEDQPDPGMKALMEEHGVTLDELGEAIGAYIRFIMDAQKGPAANMIQALEDSGWNQVRWQARVPIFYYTGGIITGAFFQGIRDATEPNDPVISQVTDLLSAGRLLDAYLSMSPLARWFFRRIKRYRKFVYVTLGIVDDQQRRVR